MKKVILILFSALFYGCSLVVPLKGNYPGKPTYGFSDRPIDEVWNRLIDVVTDHGLNVKFIDKGSGLVISEDVSLLSYGSNFRSITHEDRKGRIIEPGAYVIAERLSTVEPKKMKHNSATAKWSVVLRPAGEKTAIKVVLSNIDIYNTGQHRYYSIAFRFKAHSLGNFENWLYNEIK